MHQVRDLRDAFDAIENMAASAIAAIEQAEAEAKRLHAIGSDASAIADDICDALCVAKAAITI